MSKPSSKFSDISPLLCLCVCVSLSLRATVTFHICMGFVPVKAVITHSSTTVPLPYTLPVTTDCPTLLLTRLWKAKAGSVTHSAFVSLSLTGKWKCHRGPKFCTPASFFSFLLIDHAWLCCITNVNYSNLSLFVSFWPFLQKKPHFQTSLTVTPKEWFYISKLIFNRYWVEGQLEIHFEFFQIALLSPLAEYTAEIDL